MSDDTTPTGSQLVLRAQGADLAVGWPGFPGATDYFETQRRAYAESDGARVPVAVHAAFGADLAVTLDVILAPSRFIVVASDGQTRVSPPMSEVQPLSTFFTSPTQCIAVGTQNTDANRRALNPNEPGISEGEKQRRLYALATWGLLADMYADRVVVPERSSGLIQALAVAGVIVAVAAFEEWMAHLDHVAEVEADASVRREREMRAAAARDYVERLRAQAASPTHTLPPPSANEMAAQSAIQRRAASAWEDISRNVAETASSLTSAAMWLAGAWLAIEFLSSNKG